MKTDQSHRLAAAAAYRQIASEIETNPALPVPCFPEVHVVARGATEEASAEQVRKAAAAMNVEPAESDHSIKAERRFGPVAYRVVAVTEQAMKAHHALVSYSGVVIP